MERDGLDKRGIWQVGKGALLALAISLSAVFIFACILRISGGNGGWVYPMHQTVKAIAVCVGVLTCVRGEKGFWKGIGVGALFFWAAYLLFSAIGGDFSLSWIVVGEFAVTLLLGALSGAIAVNLKKQG